MASVLTNRGKEIIVDRIMGSGTEPKYIGWGTGAGTAAATDTTLFTEADSRATGTSSKVTTTTTNDTYQVVGTITAGSNETITNVGLFDASSAGNLFVKSDFTGLALNSGDAIQFTIKTKFS